MILRKSQVHLPQHKIGLIEFQTLRLFCRAEMLSSLLLFKIGFNCMLLYMYNYIYILFSFIWKKCLVTTGYTWFKISNIFSSSTFRMSCWMNSAWSWAASRTPVLSSVHQRSISGLLISKSDFPRLTSERFSDREQGRGWSLPGYYCDFKSKRTEESFLRGNTISSKQNCFLGEAPRHKCEERDSRKGKSGKFHLRKRERDD